MRLLAPTVVKLHENRTSNEIIEAEKPTTITNEVIYVKMTTAGTVQIIQPKQSFGGIPIRAPDKVFLSTSYREGAMARPDFLTSVSAPMKSYFGK